MFCGCCSPFRNDSFSGCRGHGIQDFKKMKAANEKETTSDTLDRVAYMLLKENKVNDAIRIFQENAEAFPT